MFGRRAYFGASADPGVSQVQRALALLALTVGDKALAVKNDGITGPQTAAATNKALTKYVSNAPAMLKTGKLTPVQVKQNAAVIASLIAATAQKKSATSAPKPIPAAPRASRAQVQQMQTAIRNLGVRTGAKVLQIAADGIVGPKTVAAVNQAVKSHAVFSRQVSAADLADPKILSAIASTANSKAAAVSQPVAPAPKKQTPSPTVKRLQQAVAKLGKLTGDKTLQIAADGIVGPKTRAAINRALAAYVKSAPLLSGSGRGFGNWSLGAAEVSDAQIIQNAEQLTKAVESEIARRGATPPPRPAAAPKPGVSRSPAITQIQESLGQLGKMVSDPGLIVVVDGINGPKTTAAVNRAMIQYVRSGPASMRTGKLSVAQVSAMAPAIIDALGVEISRRGQAQQPAPAVPTPAPEPENTVPEEQSTEEEAEASVPEQQEPEEPMDPRGRGSDAPPEGVTYQPPTQQQYVPPIPVPELPQSDLPEPEYIPPPPPQQQYMPQESYQPDTYTQQPGNGDNVLEPTSIAPSTTPVVAVKKPSKAPLYVGIGLGVVTLGGLAYFAFKPKKSYRR